MGRVRRLLPEVVSVLVALPVMWLSFNVCDELWLQDNPLIILGFLAFAVALFSACVYRLAKRPKMWTHLPIQICCVVISFSHGFPANPILWGIFVFVGAFFIVAAVLPVCSVYSFLCSRRFAENLTQGSETSEQ